MPGDMAAFIRAVELGGFSAAARDLELTPSALSKLVTRLEARLGVRLLNRTTRKLALTSEGEVYFLRCQRILAEIEEAESEIMHFRDRPKGLLRLNAGVAFGMHQLVPALPQFLARFPDVEIDLTITDNVVDLIEEGADLAIRTGALSDSTLIARKICDLERVICAAPAYLKQHGMPREPRDLLDHNCITLGTASSLKRWPFNTDNGVVRINVHGTIIANSADALRQLAIMGAGIVRLGDNIVGDDLAQGRLLPVLAERHHAEPLPVHALYPQGRHRSPKVIAMVDFLLEHFAHMPWRSTPPRKLGRVKK